jgi:hypothetical protein
MQESCCLGRTTGDTHRYRAAASHERTSDPHSPLSWLQNTQQNDGLQALTVACALTYGYSVAN